MELDKECSNAYAAHERIPPDKLSILLYKLQVSGATALFD